MGVLKIKPYKMLRLVRQVGYNDERGDWHEGATKWQEISKSCDLVVSAGNASVTSYNDGDNVGYSYTAYLPNDIEELKLGETIRVVRTDDTIVAEGFVKGFIRYQLQTKVWF